MRQRLILKSRRLLRKEGGQAFIIVLLMMLLGGLIIAPMMSFTGTGLQVGEDYTGKTQELYAADAGLEDGLWQIKHDDMQSFDGYNRYAFYDYSSSYEWEYDLGESVNDEAVHVGIRNVWIPSDIPAPSRAKAESIINTGKLAVSGWSSGGSDYYIKLDYYGQEGEKLRIKSIGLWLPPGFDYTEGSFSLEEHPGTTYYPTSVHITPYGGGQAVIWDFGTPFLFTDLPNMEGSSPFTTTLSLKYGSDSEASPAAVAWMNTSGVAEIPFAWDAGNRVFNITASSQDTDINSYVVMPSGGNSDIFGGALVAAGNISLGKDNTVSGDIVYGDSFSYGKGFDHTSGEIMQSDVEFPSSAENEAFADSVKEAAMAVETWYGSYSIGKGDGSTVTDLGPIYITGNLDIAKDNIINFQGPIYVGGNIDMHKDCEFTGEGTVVAVGDIWLAKSNDYGAGGDSMFMSLKGSFDFRKEITIKALLYAPQGTVEFRKEAHVEGSVLAQEIWAAKNGNFNQNYSYYDSFHLPGYTSGDLQTMIWEIN